MTRVSDHCAFRAFVEKLRVPESIRRVGEERLILAAVNWIWRRWTRAHVARSVYFQLRVRSVALARATPL